MEYAAMTFWLFVIVFCAMGVHQLWSSLIQPKVVNIILLPGTLVAQVGHIIGLLVTGGTVNNTTLIKDNDSAEPEMGGDPGNKVPILGSIIIAVLPMAGCAIAIYWTAHYFGTHFIVGIMQDSPFDRMMLPTSLPNFFAMLRGELALVEHLIDVIRKTSPYHDWHTYLFMYLVVCLTVRMAPMTGNLRGSLGAILLFGIISFLIGQLMKPQTSLFESAWPLVTFSVATLLLLLIFSLLVTGAVKLIKTILDY
ncbi:MAG: hypothetical protein FWC56_02200 [Phycisphaerae bacterium]|nr:hypothetical protein [Phycisphaerae bacterium]